MTIHIRPEEIYDAATDAELFDGLSAVLAERLGARSGVLHWRHVGDGTEEISYSGYFQPEHMEAYGRHFADADLWSLAVRAPSSVNRAWNCEDLISRPVYERSRIYNEWVRPMGDDTFYCLGGMLQLGPIVAEFGFHRGSGQAAFGSEEVDALNRQLGHLQKLILIRHKLAAAERVQASHTAAEEVIGYAVFTLDTKGRLLHLNRAAEALLRRGDGIFLREGRLHAASSCHRAGLAAAIARAGTSQNGEPGALVIGRKDGRFYEVSVVSAWTAAGRQLVVVVDDPRSRDVTLPARLRARFGLSAAEAEVAIALAEGGTLNDLAERRGTSLGTIRSQVKSIAGKLGCGRQSEIVATIRTLPRLTGA